MSNCNIMEWCTTAFLTEMLISISIYFFLLEAVSSTENVYIDVVRNIQARSSLKRIFGGEFSKINQFPHQVSIRWGDLEEKTHICGGSIIGKKTILTAAHCKVYDYGEYDITLGLFSQKHPKPFVIPINDSNWITHKKFLGGANPYDIALIVLNEEISFSEAVNKIELGGENHTSVFLYNKCIISGWGATSPNILASEILKYVQLKRISNVECFNVLKDIFPDRSIPPLDDTMICTKEDANLSTCVGDSGGSLFVEDNGVRYQIGIASWGVGPCGMRAAPAAYTKTLAYKDWIELYWRN